jgi:hypothetical protein
VSFHKASVVLGDGGVISFLYSYVWQRPVSLVFWRRLRLSSSVVSCVVMVLLSSSGLIPWASWFSVNHVQMFCAVFKWHRFEAGPSLHLAPAGWEGVQFTGFLFSSLLHAKCFSHLGHPVAFLKAPRGQGANRPILKARCGLLACWLAKVWEDLFSS